MGKVVKVLQGTLRHYDGKAGHEALKYIETGDAGALGRIRSTRMRWESWAHQLPRALSAPGEMDVEDRRALHALAAVEAFEDIGGWLARAMAGERPGENLTEAVRAEMETVKVPPEKTAAMIAAFVPLVAQDGRPNSAGRYLLTLPDSSLRAAAKKAATMQGAYIYEGIARFLLDSAPERLEPLLEVMIAPSSCSSDLCRTLLEKGEGRYVSAVHEAVKGAKSLIDRLSIAEVLVQHDPARFRDEMREIARQVLADRKAIEHHDDAGVWLIKNLGDESLPEILAYMKWATSTTPKRAEWNHFINQKRITVEAAEVLGKHALPVILAALPTHEGFLHHAALSELCKLDDGTHRDRILSELRRAFADSGDVKPWTYGQNDSEHLAEYVKLAAGWDAEATAEDVWKLVGHRLKLIRRAAALTLGRMGDAVVPRAAGLLLERKADLRAAAVLLLATAGSPAAMAALEARVDEEGDDDVRDAMLMALDAARAAAGVEVSREEIDRRIQRTAPKLRAPAVDWIDETRLPPLRYREGGPLGPEATRYLLYRQSRAKEIRPDIEARPLFERIDRQTSGDFALELLRQFAASKLEARDRWALTVAGLLGDDRVVAVLNPMIRTWGDSARGKMAEFAVQALALLGTDAALMSLDAASIRYRTRNRNIGAAAQEALAAVADRLGVTVDELGDRIIPWLGFEPGRPRILGAEGKRIEATIGPDFKLRYRDVEKNKAVASLPKSLPRETLAEFKDLAATLREVARAQTLRMEILMVRQFRWPVDRWRELFLGHSVLFLPFATRLVWGYYDESGTLRATFRALEDRTLTDPSDEPVELPDAGSVGIVHPMELDETKRAAWRTHLADYEVEPPFPQLERPVVRVPDDQREVRISDEVSGVSLNAMTFRSRAEKRGWSRGSVTDAGGVDTYRKVFPGAGAEAFLGLDGMYVGIDRESDIQLGDFYFVRAGTVKIGSYVYDNPRDEDDARLIPFGSVPPIVYSEVAGDLRSIAGKAGESEPAEGE